ALPPGASTCPRCGADPMTVSSTPTRLFGDPAGAGDPSEAPTSVSGSPSGGGGGRGGPSSPSSSPSHRDSMSHAAFGGSAPAGGAHFSPGQRLGDRYRIGALIGKGGMGEVYRADDLKLGMPVALKLLPPVLAQDPERLERFYAEVRLARQVSHPNVCRVYD